MLDGLKHLVYRGLRAVLRKLLKPSLPDLPELGEGTVYVLGKRSLSDLLVLDIISTRPLSNNSSVAASPIRLPPINDEIGVKFSIGLLARHEIASVTTFPRDDTFCR